MLCRVDDVWRRKFWTRTTVSALSLLMRCIMRKLNWIKFYSILLFDMHGRKFYWSLSLKCCEIFRTIFGFWKSEESRHVSVKSYVNKIALSLMPQARINVNPWLWSLLWVCSWLNRVFHSIIKCCGWEPNVQQIKVKNLNLAKLESKNKTRKPSKFNQKYPKSLYLFIWMRSASEYRFSFN